MTTGEPLHTSPEFPEHLIATRDEMLADLNARRGTESWDNFAEMHEEVVADPVMLQAYVDEMARMGAESKDDGLEELRASVYADETSKRYYFAKMFRLSRTDSPEDL
jgi:hypothetical protein